MSGRIINPKWGNKADTFSFSMEDERATLDRWLPPHIITKDWFPNAPDISLGMPITVLFGHTATVCPLIEDGTSYKYYLIAGHHLWRPSGGWFSAADGYTGIFVDGYSNDAHTPFASGDNANNFEVINGSVYDFNSKPEYRDIPISYLKYSKEPDVVLAGGEGISNQSVVTGLFAGMPLRWEDSPDVPYTFPRDIITLLYYLYTRYTGYSESQIDVDSFQGAFEDGLNLWNVNSAFNGFGSDRMKTIDTIHRRLLPQVPLFEFYNNGKLAVKFINIWGDKNFPYHGISTDPTVKADLIYGFNVLDRAGLIEEGDLSEIRNDFIVKYNPDIHQQGGPYVKVLQFTNGTGPQIYKDPVYPTEVIIHPACVNSAAKFGHRPGEIIYCQDLFYQDLALEPPVRGRTAAHLLCEWMAYFYTFRPKYIPVICDHSTAFLNPGDFVTYSEDNIGYSYKKCLIISKNVESYKITYKLRTWENMSSPDA